MALPGITDTVSFKYDPFGRRIEKTTSSATSIYAYDGDDLVEETNSSGSVVARYAHGAEIDEALAMLRSGTASYYHADGLGSVTSLSSAAGSIANTYTYDSFGNLTNSTGSLVNPFRYTARESDSETGLYYYRRVAKTINSETLLGVGRVAQTINPKKILGAAYAGFACAGLESTSSQTSVEPAGGEDVSRQRGLEIMGCNSIPPPFFSSTGCPKVAQLRVGI
jgi:hypothetical protein